MLQYYSDFQFQIWNILYLMADYTKKKLLTIWFKLEGQNIFKEKYNNIKGIGWIFPKLTLKTLILELCLIISLQLPPSKSQLNFCLALLVSIPDEEKKLSWIFIFTLLCGVSKGFLKAFKAFKKPFEAPQRSAKIKKINFYFNTTFWNAQRGKG